MPYKRIEEATSKQVFAYGTGMIFYKEILEDDIHQKDLEEKLKLPKYASLKAQNLIAVTESNHHYYEISSLFEVNDICNANNSNNDSPGVKKASLNLEPNTVASVDIQEGNDITKAGSGYSALFDFGDGNDIAVGYKDKKNIFKVGQGIKKYTGGKRSDAFHLFSSMLPSAPSVPSYFDGMDGRDIIIAAYDITEIGYSGYSIDLEKKKVHYRSPDGTLKLVAKLKNIENIYGHKKTRDHLTGNEHNNMLNGIAGKDTIWGKGGDGYFSVRAR